jgi:RecJ-like exonuclease
MFKNQLDKVVAEKNAAMSIFVVTKNKFEASCKKAKAFIDKNLNEINKKEQEIISKQDVNLALQDQIVHMESSVAQINTIINPTVVKIEDAGNDIKVTEIKEDKAS